MSHVSSGSHLSAGLAALGEGRWAGAAAALTAVVDGDGHPPAEALAALGDASWWLGEPARSLELPSGPMPRSASAATRCRRR